MLGVDLDEAFEEELGVEGVVRVDVGEFVLPLVAPLVMHLLHLLLGEGPEPGNETFPLEELHDVDEDEVALQGYGGVEVAVGDLKLLDGFPEVVLKDLAVARDNNIIVLAENPCVVHRLEGGRDGQIGLLGLLAEGVPEPDELARVVAEEGVGPVNSPLNIVALHEALKPQFANLDLLLGEGLDERGDNFAGDTSECV